MLIDRLVSISGQRGQTLIFATHTARKLQASLILDMDAIVLKEPSLLHGRMERRETRDLTLSARRFFDTIPDSERKKHTYVISDDYEGGLRNPLPEWWTEELSQAWNNTQGQKSEAGEEGGMS